MSRSIEMVVTVDDEVTERMPMNTGFDISIAHFRAFRLLSPREKARVNRDTGLTGPRCCAQYLTLIEGAA